jgi:hypothetical protein
MRTAQRVAVLLATAMVPAVVVFAVRHNSTSLELAEIPTQPVLVGTVTLSTTAPAPGDAVTATVTLGADRRLRLDGITVAVRDERGRAVDVVGRSYDFPDFGALDLGTTQKTFTLSRPYGTRGTYVYFLEYRTGSIWHPLAPYASFVVG